MRSVLPPLELFAFRKDMTGLFTLIRIEENKPFPQIGRCSNIERHSKWIMYATDLLSDGFVNISGKTLRVLEKTAESFENRINIWHLIEGRNTEWRSKEFRKLIPSTESLLSNPESRIVRICIKKLLNTENAYKYNNAEYIDEHYQKKIRELNRVLSNYQTAAFICENIFEKADILEIIKKDCRTTGFNHPQPEVL